ncbi:MAG TPA: hypothetical protein VFC24_15755 [Casimicrobiaceae bacterium]|nr:hypothetical protein [Casimicrobiaceae bacterium]
MTRERERRGARRREGSPSPQSTRATQDRTRIAQATARLIAEHGLTDWSAAKRKAARQLGIPEGLSLPSNEDVQQALADYHSLFADEAHAASLQAQRRVALRWMRRLERWSPLLVGGVAAGWATSHSDVRIELVADDPKSVEMTLVGNGVTYAASSARGDESTDGGGTQLLIRGDEANVRLSILSANQRRNRPRREDDPRLTIAELEALLERQ